ncbi:class I adenylate cyclase [Pseudomaricurvus alcaniphilus]|uniref:class I adenylate cyclase n=1 Tax=Pseudomaricurvus alcaniphilus TaxID=1166482 RepID=UPI001408AD49|nr:class I adenylate cyclase [Pseudomaricurvus alcaniphilus]NHN38607.1 class I adenylate cyclase [Pseudomaricurvus alcaniphilus]
MPNPDQSELPPPPTAVAEDRNALGIEPQQLRELRRRFLHINQLRLERTRQSLAPRQRLILDLLPLLLHVNHPALPGYISQATAAGLHHYKPGKVILRAARQLTRSFTYSALQTGRQDIQALYVMGSVGTIGQSRGSDLDIWVCHSPGLAPVALAELQKKCARISDWCLQRNLEVCFFPMDCDQFRSGASVPLSAESSGSAQHGLLLDEFYRSAIHLGGRYPLWWFVPAQQEANYHRYSSELLHKRFIRNTEVIDFGIPRIPAAEYISAAIWQLYKGIHSPYKSVLKLALLEVYAAQYPDTGLLSSRFKQRVEDGCDDVDQLDPYLLVYEAVEGYMLAQKADQRLQLVRRCLYFKVDQPLSRRPAAAPLSWQRQQLQQLVDNWHWDRQQLQLLDSRRQWKTARVAGERQQLVTELLRSYRNLSGFVRSSHTRLPRIENEIALLGRKLYAAFERKAGKIEWINPDIAPDLGEAYLTLEQSGSNQHRQWQLLNQPPGREADAVQLKSSVSALELIVWAYCNQVLAPQTQSWLQSPATGAYPLGGFYQALRQWLALPLAAAPHAAFAHKPVATSIMLVVNLYDPPRLDSLGAELELDPLNFGNQCQSLVNDAHIIVHNSWNEVYVHSYVSRGLESVLAEYLRQMPPGSRRQDLKLTVFCREGSMATQLQRRLQGLVNQLQQCFYRPGSSASARFVLANGGTFSCWQFIDRQLRVQQLADLTQLLDFLGEPQAQLSAIHFDQYTLAQHPLAVFARLPASSAIQIGYRPLGQRAELYVLDEKGSLFYADAYYYSEASLLRPLHQFIRNVIARENLTAATDGPLGIYPVEFYRLQQRPADAGYTNERRDVINDVDSLDFFNIQVIVDSDPFDQLHYTIYCDQREFHQSELGAELFSQVASHILSQRAPGEIYPCYITDLDLSHCGQRLFGNQPLQISHYLRLKTDIERQLNHAMQQG